MALSTLPALRCVLLSLLLLNGLIAIGAAQEEEAVFSNDEPAATSDLPDDTRAPSHPATTYWRVGVTMTLTTVAPGTRVQMLLPLSDGRQSVLARHTSVENVRYREETDGLNLWGHWEVIDTTSLPYQITYSYTVQIADLRINVPTVPFPIPALVSGVEQYLRPSPLIQSDAQPVRSLARRLTQDSKEAGQAVRALYRHVMVLRAPDTGREKSDALSVLLTERGGRIGKTRALVALLRAVGIPARVVGGMRLGDAAYKRTTIAWVEAFIGDTWVPMDPTEGHFAWLPHSYLALYRDDLPLLTHTRQTAVTYSFSIRQLTRTAAFSTEQFPMDVLNGGRQAYESAAVHTRAVYVEQPHANVVLIHDGSIPQEVVARILASAQDARLNLAVLSVGAVSYAVREHYFHALVSQNLALIREAHVVLLNTAGTAGLYAFLKQGELGLKLRELRMVVASDVALPVRKILATVLLQLLEPADIVLIPYEPQVVRLWDIARARILQGAAPHNAATQQCPRATRVTLQTVRELGWWRQQVVALWVAAVRKHVALPALNLILVLPLIAFFLVIIRNVIGLETFGTFSPMLLALAFLTTGLGWGLIVFAIIVGLGTGLRLLLQHLRLHLVARVAILIAVVSVCMAGLTVLGAVLGIGGLLHVSIFPMVIMANMIENFTNTQLERGAGEALRLTLSTLLVATCSYVGIENTGVKPFVLAYPEVLIAVIGVEILLGRWRGLRLLEYVRFYHIVRCPRVEPAVETRKVSVG
jgi:transglutaminase-like putative cysteine protease